MYRRAIGLIIVVAALAGVPATVQAASSTVSIAVPPTLRLEGTTSITLAPGAAALQGQLVVKSNIRWVLVARTAGASEVIWNSASGRRALGAQTVVLQGPGGVHTVEFEVRLQTGRSGLPVQVTFALEPAL